MSTAQHSIEKWRGKINAINRVLLAQLNARVRIARRIGAIKKKTGLAVSDEKREKAILTAMRALNKGPLDSAAVNRVFSVIIAETKRLEKRTVA
ncbi:MAG: hypothetical protein A2268_08970 [Candidatus Raymondbacteria bacterium RifOxyA12_full_50_37]|uniref:Chorismate mutase domain-containing protein n=1 Tax=Candidatus Raymondbacteria bacterium RIFOXYD12_FULL_49_13 TaxID=1817890 RepID=A0A1F7FG60_UNCRA|nr:MAG: hypothetical protein A2268_08970 [Candidatus Raymondbacteria bacterium RifOxyA12_full_50_37]OGJ92930.1 MAG: hypothetical protein A2248_08670 [Candidatus Raymondbacteria bacterium RIFOXYA2_FULL_49_16]OGK03820.1 MAG: hypothetical protein A2487_04235 [Candidatus Raymondbacteria bacterium RifOxyC12_full_50_8]OGK05684.1 MAG: hypothetical protein A2519_03800 [Candidatus Raymondbacteria bacterium RIFOXYD12_FULL_49_13]OGP44691.1 MAG: hypothetical protein A2324_08565 [Candidatus Raymondbacteria 